MYVCSRSQLRLIATSRWMLIQVTYINSGLQKKMPRNTWEQVPYTVSIELRVVYTYFSAFDTSIISRLFRAGKRGAKAETTATRHTESRGKENQIKWSTTYVYFSSGKWLFFSPAFSRRKKGRISRLPFSRYEETEVVRSRVKRLFLFFLLLLNSRWNVGRPKLFAWQKYLRDQFSREFRAAAAPFLVQ